MLPPDSKAVAHLRPRLWAAPRDDDFVVLLDSATIPTPDGLARVRQAMVDSGAAWVQRRLPQERRRTGMTLPEGRLQPGAGVVRRLRDAIGDWPPIGNRPCGWTQRPARPGCTTTWCCDWRPGARIHHLAHRLCVSCERSATGAVTDHLATAEQTLSGDLAPPSRWQSSGRCHRSTPNSRASSGLDDLLEAIPITIVIPTRIVRSPPRRCLRASGER